MLLKLIKKLFGSNSIVNDVPSGWRTADQGGEVIPAKAITCLEWDETQHLVVTTGDPLEPKLSKLYSIP